MSDIKNFFVKYYFYGAMASGILYELTDVVAKVEKSGPRFEYATMLKPLTRKLAIVHSIGFCCHVLAY